MIDEPNTSEEPTPDDPAEQTPDQPSEEELRRRIEEGLREVRVQDVLLESVATLINLTARRIGKPDERDLDQARVGIEAVRAVVGLLEAEPQAQVRDALSELQMLYARHSGGAPDPDGPQSPEPPAPEPPPAPGEPRPAGDSGLWVPPGSSQ
ncbi:MAG: hypothetical protein ABI726_07835 [bacterium]